MISRKASVASINRAGGSGGHSEPLSRGKLLKFVLLFFINFYFSSNDSSSKTMKNAFYFI